MTREITNPDIIHTLSAIVMIDQINKMTIENLDGPHIDAWLVYQKYFGDVYNNFGIDEFAMSNELLLLEYDLGKLLGDTTSRQSLIIDESERIQRIIYDVYKDNDRLFTIEPRHFEELVAELLRRQGFEVELSKQTRDGGYDILALHGMEAHGPIKFLVECKRYAASRAVGVEIIRGVKEVIETQGANRGIIVTTSYFSRDAIKKQKETPYKLELRAKNDLIEWIHKYCKSFNSASSR